MGAQVPGLSPNDHPNPSWGQHMGFGKNRILLPSAVHLEERLTVSQSVPEPGQQSVRQKHTVWVFCQWQMRPQAVGRPFAPDQAIKQWPNGNAADRRLFGRRFEPQSGEHGTAAATTAKSRPTRIRTADRKLCVSCVTIRPAVVC